MKQDDEHDEELEKGVETHVEEVLRKHQAPEAARAFSQYSSMGSMGPLRSVSEQNCLHSFSNTSQVKKKLLKRGLRESPKLFNILGHAPHENTKKIRDEIKVLIPGKEHASFEASC